MLTIGSHSVEVVPTDLDGISLDGMPRPVPTRGVLDPLEVNVLVLEYGSESVVVAITDSLFVTAEDLEIARNLVAEIKPGARLMLCATHSHSASPSVAGSTDCGEQNARTIRNAMVAAFEKALRLAVQDQKPAEVAGARIPCPQGFAGNRRVKLENGSAISAFGGVPIIPPGVRAVACAGPVPEFIDLLAFRHPGESSPCALIASFASHIHLYEVPMVSSENGGAARRAIRNRLPGVTALYGMSFSGDIALQFAHPRPSDDESLSIRWQAESMETFGENFADAVVRALGSLHYEIPDALTYSLTELPGERNEEFTMVETLRIGSHALCSLPGEFFFEFEALLRQNLPAASLTSLCYNRSWLGYIAPAMAFEEGSYEVMRGPSDHVPYPNPDSRAKSSTRTGHDVIALARSQIAELFSKA